MENACKLLNLNTKIRMACFLLSPQRGRKVGPDTTNLEPSNMNVFKTGTLAVALSAGTLLAGTALSLRGAEQLAKNWSSVAG